MKKQTVTIGIPAYNSEKNIGNIIDILVKQSQKNYKLNEIIVLSDASSDNTVIEARRINDKRIIVIDSKQRHGMAHGVLKMLSKNTSEVFIIINDDILITDKNLIDKVLKPIISDKKIGLVSPNYEPLKGRTFVERAGISTHNAYEKIRFSIKKGNNKYSCEGKFLVLTKSFIDTIRFPKDLKKIATADIFFYLSCIKNGFKFRHVKNAKIYYRYPNSTKDYISWNMRNYTSARMMRELFGSLVEKEYRMPKIAMMYLLEAFFKNPLGCLYIYLIGKYCSYKARTSYKNFTPTWNIVSSTKHLQ